MTPMRPEPAEQSTSLRRDWRETVRIATDLALLGFLTALAALPVVTAGAAVAASSAAVHHHLEYDRWPGPRACWAVFRRRLLSGFLVSAGCAAAAALVVADLLALHSGAVPGGLPGMALTAGAALAAAGYAGLRVVGTGAADSDRYSGVADPAPSGGSPQPAEMAAGAGVLAVAVVLGVLVHPVLTPVVAAYTLFALHVIARRTRVRPAPASPPSASALPQHTR
jgi:hypothetical protein